MALKTKLAPFMNKFCELKFTRKVSTTLAGKRWRLYFFDFKSLDGETRELIQDEVDEDDYEICGLVDPPEETGSVGEMVEDGVGGFLLWSDTGRMFAKLQDQGELEVVASDLDAMLGALRVLDEGEEAE